jgi:hypothetical protein
MDKPALKRQLEQLLELVDGFLGREQTEQQKKEKFIAHRDEMLAQIPAMGDVLGDYPYFGAVAFLGKFRFADVDAAELDALAERASLENFKRLVKKKNMQVAENAKPAWTHLHTSRPEILAVIVAVCYMSEKNVKVKRVLN